MCKKIFGENREMETTSRDKFEFTSLQPIIVTKVKLKLPSLNIFDILLQVGAYIPCMHNLLQIFSSQLLSNSNYKIK